MALESTNQQTINKLIDRWLEIFEPWYNWAAIASDYIRSTEFNREQGVSIITIVFTRYSQYARVKWTAQKKFYYLSFDVYPCVMFKNEVDDFKFMSYLLN